MDQSTPVASVGTALPRPGAPSLTPLPLSATSTTTSAESLSADTRTVTSLAAPWMGALAWNSISGRPTCARSAGVVLLRGGPGGVAPFLAVVRPTVPYR